MSEEGRYTWETLRVQSMPTGEKSFEEEAYLTITVPGDESEDMKHQVVVMPDAGILLARWVGRGPVDLRALRKRAADNVPYLQDPSALERRVDVGEPLSV